MKLSMVNHCYDIRAFGIRGFGIVGHLVSNRGVSAEATRIEAMTNRPIPENVKQLRGFLVLTGYYRRFVEGYGKVSTQVNQLLRKDSFHWTK